MIKRLEGKLQISEWERERDRERERERDRERGVINRIILLIAKSFVVLLLKLH